MGCWISKCDVKQEPEQGNPANDGTGQSGVFNPTSFNSQTSGGFHMFEFHGATVGNVAILLGIIAVFVVGVFVGWRFIKKRINRRREDAFNRESFVRFSARRANLTTAYDMVHGMPNPSTQLAIAGPAPSAPEKLPPHYSMA